MQYHQISRALLLSLILASCGGSGPSTPPPPPVTEHAVTISSVSGTTQSRLACNKGVDTKFCNIRTYQIMVEAFIDGDSTADYNAGYGPSHHKGDLQGIINSLDYIKSTGVNAIWLTPIFHSIANPGQTDNRLDATGYFTSDYFNVDPHFGTNEQFRTLVDTAHAKGLYVFLDGVFGHFKDNIVASPGGLLPTKGACRKDDGSAEASTLPNACPDYASTATLDFFKEVSAYWINEYKIDGWRLDQAYQVPTTAWDALRTHVNSASAAVTYTDINGNTVNPLGYMVGEIWDGGGSNTANRGYGTIASPGLRSNFDFPSRYKIVQTLASQEESSASGAMNQPASSLNYGFNQSAYPDFAMPNLMMGNHDLVRFGDLIQRGGLGNPNQSVYWDRHKAAFSFMTAFSGPITLYYGEEIGQELPGYAAQVGGDCAAIGRCDDHVSRTSGKVSGLTSDEAALKTHVANLMSMRAANPALVYGTRTHVFSDSAIYVDRKDAGSNHVLFLLNTKTIPAIVTLNADVIGSPGNLTDLLSMAVVSATDSKYTITVPALSGRFLKF